MLAGLYALCPIFALTAQMGPKYLAARDWPYYQCRPVKAVKDHKIRSDLSDKPTARHSTTYRNQLKIHSYSG